MFAGCGFLHSNLPSFRSAIKNPPEGYKCELSDEEVEQQAQKLLSDLETGGKAHKRRTFISCWHESEHEREVRALLMDFECQDLGKMVPCDLAILIEKVFLSPRAPAWFIDLVNDINAKYGVQVKVSTSELIEKPFF